MSTKRGERILGPYAQHNGWRVVEISAAGERKSTLHDTEGKANRFIEVLRAELAKEDHTTETALAEYKAHLTALGNKTDSVRQTIWAIGCFFPSPLALALLSKKRCETLYETMRTATKEDGSPRFSVDTHRSALIQSRTFLNWCITKGWLRENPCAGIKGIGKRRPRGKSLGKSGAELRVKDARAWYGMALFRASRGDHGATAALVALLLGMRASEIVTRTAALARIDPGLLVKCDPPIALRRGRRSWWALCERSARVRSAAAGSFLMRG